MMIPEQVFSKLEPSIVTHLVLKQNSDLLINSKIQVSRQDLIPAENSLQASWIKMKQNETFLPHVHDERVINERIANTQECWAIVKGKVEASLFDFDAKLIKKIQLDVGDFVFTLRGGHNYRCLSDDAEVCEIKSGPYDSLNDKRRF